MRRLIGWGLVVCVFAPGAVSAQTVDAPARQFLRDVGGDYLHFFSWDNLVWLGEGGVASLAVHQADDYLRQETEDPSLRTARALNAGQSYGNLSLQVPLALAWWIAGHAAGSAKGSAAGHDLLRAQISALSWTYGLKFAVNRTRPNGDPRSFPSGHASATFATATVLQQHYGWKLGVPAFAAASYTAASRVSENKHWASDVAFGAFLGIAGGRTVTLQLREARLSIAPLAVPGGGGVLVTALR